MSVTKKQRNNLWKAPSLFVTTMHLYGVKSNWYQTLSGFQFIPICQYPVDVDILDREVGSIVRMSPNGTIAEVKRRIIHLSGKVKR